MRSIREKNRKKWDFGGNKLNQVLSASLGSILKSEFIEAGVGVV